MTIKMLIENADRKFNRSWLWSIGLTLFMSAFLGAGCRTLAPSASVRNDDISALASQVSKEKSITSTGVMFEVILGSESPSIKASMKLESSNVVYSCHTSSGAEAILHFDPLIATNHSSWKGSNVTVVGFMDAKASQQFQLPVIKAVTCKLNQMNSSKTSKFVSDDSRCHL